MFDDAAGRREKGEPSEGLEGKREGEEASRPT